MSADGRYHASKCTVSRAKGHVDGKWCWTEADVESLEKQHAQQMTWNQIAETFKFHDAKGNLTCYRHHSFACQAKMNALLLGDNGDASSKKLASLAKRPRASKPSDNKPIPSPKKHKTADIKEDQSNKDDTDIKEAEEAMSKVVIQVDSDSD